MAEIIGAALGIINKAFGKWFSKEATQARRATNIEKLEQEQLDLIKKNKGGSSNRRLSRIAAQLKQLHQATKNER